MVNIAIGSISPQNSIINLTNRVGIIQSPGYPDNYGHGLKYTWKISAPTNDLVLFEIKNFETEANHDILEVIIVSDNKNTSHGNYSGLVKPQRFISYFNEVILKFISDGNIDGKGFEISYKFVDTGVDPKFLIQTPYSLLSAGFNESVQPHIYQAYNKEFAIGKWFTLWELFHQYSKNFEMSMLTLSVDKTDKLSINYILFYDSYSKQIHIISNNSLDIIEDSVGAIAFDSTHNLLIWTDIQNRFIKIVKINETKTVYIFNNTIQSITNQMLINSEKSALIWTVLGYNPRIIETNFDGSNQLIIYNNSKQVSHLTIDYGKQRYYFIHIKNFALYSIDFNGANEIYYMKSPELFHINNMFVWNNNLYLSNKELVYKIPDLDIKLMKAHILYYSYDYYKFLTDFKKDKSDLFFRKKSHNIPIYDFQSIIPLEYKNSYSNKCSSNQCSHLCLPMRNSYRCVCPLNYLLVNKAYCKAVEEDTIEHIDWELVKESKTKNVENDKQSDIKLHDKILQILNESRKNYIDSDDLVEKHNNFKLEVQNPMSLESPRITNINKFGMINFILFILIIIFNAFILYYVYKKTKSTEKYLDKRKESKIPLIVLNNDCPNDEINIQTKSTDNQVFSKC